MLKISYSECCPMILKLVKMKESSSVGLSFCTLTEKKILTICDALSLKTFRTILEIEFKAQGLSVRYAIFYFIL